VQDAADGRMNQNADYLGGGGGGGGGGGRSVVNGAPGQSERGPQRGMRCAVMCSGFDGGGASVGSALRCSG